MLSSGGMYGIERMLLDLLPRLAEKGIPNKLICFESLGTMGGQIGEKLTSRGITVYHLGYDGKFNFQGMRNLLSVIEKWSPDLVHVHGYKASIIGGGVVLPSGIPVVSTYHAEAKKTDGIGLYIWLETQIIRKFMGVAAVSDAIADELRSRKLATGRIQVIPNGIDDRFARSERMTRQEGSSPFSPSLLVVGRLIEAKNFQLVLHALNRLKAAYPTAGLVVAGEGPFKENLEKIANELNVSESVRFAGFVDNIGELMMECDCFLLPSRTEGMPISLLEAMSFELPIIASKVGTVPSVTRDGREALLVEPDNPTEIYSALCSILGNQELRLRLANNARNRFLENFTSEKMAERYIDFYDRILREPSKLP